MWSARLGLVWCVLASSVWAEPIRPEQVPSALRDWQGWVLHGQEEQRCPFLHGQGARQCFWPGTLSLSLDERGGRFVQSVRVYREGWMPLPGEAKRWPQSVLVQDRPAVVNEEGGLPVVRLPPGEHVVTGEFLWDALPESLALPRQTGLLSLQVKGRDIALPNREQPDRLFLQRESSLVEAQELDLRVQRLVTDEIPLTLTTRIDLSVSGKSRELLLGRALPTGFVPLSLESTLPVRLEANGRIRVQARAGSWSLTLVARHEGPVTELRRPEPEGPWIDGEEVWVFDARPSLRQVTLEGVSAVDPNQTSLPEDWKRLPAYAMGPGDAMRMVERRRGDAEPALDRLTLQRTLWLDFEGTGYTASDRINGQLHRSWRLDMQAPTELGRVVASGADQLITRLTPQAPEGVELRQGLLHVEADSRIPGPVSRVPAVSWDADFHRVSGVLHLPPGWRLFHAGGADDVPDTWIQRWSLLEIFLALIIALAVGKLYGVAGGALALGTLVLALPEENAPRWIWLFVLAGEALVRALPEGRVRSAAKVYRFGTWAVLLLILVPFLIEHVRHGMYPVLQRSYQQLGGMQNYNEYSAENAAAYQRSLSLQAAPRGEGASADESISVENSEPVAEAPVAASDSSFESSMRGGAVAKQLAKPAPQARIYNVKDYDKKAVVQTGPGLPRWEWARVRIGYSGPVSKGQVLRLWLLPPGLNLFLAFLRVALLCGLVLVVLNVRSGPGWRGLRRWTRSGAATAMLLALAMLGTPGPVFAETLPSPELLERLGQRLLETPTCHPSCAASPRLQVELSLDSLRARMEIHAAAETAVPLPGNGQQWMASRVLLDGRVAAAMVRDEQGTLWLAVTPGTHQVQLEGSLAGRDTVQLPLPLKSHRVEVSAQGWTVAGLHEDGLSDDSLQLSRVAGGTERKRPSLQADNLPPFVRVERDILLGMQWTAETRVLRITPVGSAVVMEVPLLPGESVTTPDVRVQNGRALVTLGPSATEARWSSVLEPRPELKLLAPPGVAWTEMWRLDVAPLWHVTLRGIPVVHAQDDAGVRRPEWRPWPGESAEIAVTRPQAVQGQTLTIDQSQLRVMPGARATDARLTANLRSARGGLHAFTLPAGAQLQGVSINGQTQPIRQEGRRVAIPLVPGSLSVELTWRQDSGWKTAWRTPELNLGTPSANAELQVEVPPDRWVLFVRGPRMGPAVLFWSFLLVLLLVAAGLGQLTLTPLRIGAWMLLLVGLSQVDILAAAVVVGWLLAIGWRERTPELYGSTWFNLRQLVLIGWSLLAAGVLAVSIYQGLLGRPEMQLTGNGSSSTSLHWFQDRTDGAYPRGFVLSLPMLVYRGAMLAWSLWLALSILAWVRWAWAAFSKGGLWKRAPQAVLNATPVAPPPTGPS